MLDDAKRPREYTAQQYLKSSEEMAALFAADAPDALDNTLDLAKRCNLALSLGTYYLPAFPVPDDHTLDSWIRREAHDGLAARLEKFPLAAGHDRASYESRLDIELDVIVTGRLVATTEAGLWQRRDAVTALLTHPPTAATLVDNHGRTWASMSFIGYVEGERVDRGRVRSVEYRAVFRRFI